MREQELIFTGAVGIGGIPKITAQLDGAVQHAQGFVIVRWAVGLAQAHTAQAELADKCVTDLSLFHHIPSITGGIIILILSELENCFIHNLVNNNGGETAINENTTEWFSTGFDQ